MRSGFPLVCSAVWLRCLYGAEASRCIEKGTGRALYVLNSCARSGAWGTAEEAVSRICEGREQGRLGMSGGMTLDDVRDCGDEVTSTFDYGLTLRMEDAVTVCPVSF